MSKNTLCKWCRKLKFCISGSMKKCKSINSLLSMSYFQHIILLKTRLRYRCFPVNFASFFSVCNFMKNETRLQVTLLKARLLHKCFFLNFEKYLSLQLNQSRDSSRGVFQWILQNFQEHIYCRSSGTAAFNVTLLLDSFIIFIAHSLKNKKI